MEVFIMVLWSAECPPEEDVAHNIWTSYYLLGAHLFFYSRDLYTLSEDWGC